MMSGYGSGWPVWEGTPAWIGMLAFVGVLIWAGYALISSATASPASRTTGLARASHGGALIKDG